MFKNILIKSFLVTLLLLFFLTPNTIAQPPAHPTEKEIAQLVGLYDLMKIPITETTISLQIEIYRNDNPVEFEDLDPSFRAEPQKTIEVGKMEIYPENQENFFFLFAFQRLSLEGRVDNIIYWGLKREGSKGEGLGKSSFRVDVSEFENPLFNWAFGQFPNIEITTDYSPIYTIKGLKTNTSGATFSGTGRDDLNTQVQMHDLVIVINCGAGI